MRGRAVGCLMMLAACGGDDEGGDASVDTSLHRPNLDAGALGGAGMDGGISMNETDAAALDACVALDVCRDGKVTGLFNVCLSSSAAGTAATTQRCLVDPNGTVYLAQLAKDQLITNVGWRQTGGLGATALRADDVAACDAALAALTADAGVCSATP